MPYSTSDLSLADNAAFSTVRSGHYALLFALLGPNTQTLEMRLAEKMKTLSSFKFQEWKLNFSIILCEKQRDCLADFSMEILNRLDVIPEQLCAFNSTLQTLQQTFFSKTLPLTVRDYVKAYAESGLTYNEVHYNLDQSSDHDQLIDVLKTALLIHLEPLKIPPFSSTTIQQDLKETVPEHVKSVYKAMKAKIAELEPMLEQHLERAASLNTECATTAHEIETIKQRHRTTHVIPLVAMKQNLPSPCNTLSDEALTELLEQSTVHLDARLPGGNTLLHEALVRYRIRSALLLIQRGIDTTLTNDMNLTAEQYSQISYEKIRQIVDADEHELTLKKSHFLTDLETVVHRYEMEEMQKRAKSIKSTEPLDQVWEGLYRIIYPVSEYEQGETFIRHFYQQLYKTLMQGTDEPLSTWIHQQRLLAEQNKWSYNQQLIQLMKPYLDKFAADHEEEYGRHALNPIAASVGKTIVAEASVTLLEHETLKEANEILQKENQGFKALEKNKRFFSKLENSSQGRENKLKEEAIKFEEKEIELQKLSEANKALEQARREQLYRQHCQMLWRKTTLENLRRGQNENHTSQTNNNATDISSCSNMSAS